MPYSLEAGSIGQVPCRSFVRYYRRRNSCWQGSHCVDAYKGMKNWTAKKLGEDAKVVQAIAEVEAALESKARQMALVEEVSKVCRAQAVFKSTWPLCGSDPKQC